nr:EOG090X0BHG [Eurycercus lamellatus]
MKISFNIFSLILLVFCLCVGSIQAWDQEELEIFDLVEELKENFYDILGVLQNCTQPEIRKAYRRLSLQLHPDKNDAPDAEVKFRQLVGVYEVLRDDGKRARYDRVLVEGLPNWRHPLYYYRRVRKMGMMELSIWLFVLFTIGQYAVSWGSYFEKKLTLEEAKASTLKKLQKQMKKSKKPNDVIDVEEEMSKQFVIPKPSFKNTLPFQIFNAVVSLPALIRWILKYREERKLEEEARKEREREEAEELEREKEEIEKEKERKLYRRKRVIPLPTYSGEADECILDSVDSPSSQTNGEVKPARVSGGLWTDEDLAELAKYMKKYPAGTTERWEKIADALNRTVNEVTHFARKMKDNAFRPPEGQEGENNSKEEERVEKKKEKTRGGKNSILLAEPTQADVGTSEEQVAGSSGWTQKQQKSLETALACYTKGSSERWERIAKAVPGKTKEECMLRVKYLSDLVKKKKQQEEDRLREDHVSEQQPSAGDDSSQSSRQDIQADVEITA